MMPKRVRSPYDWTAILRLIQTEFAYMEARIDPPSSMHKLDVRAIAEQSESGEVWVIETDAGLAACMFLTIHPDRLYLGKLAVDYRMRGQGLARCLVEQAGKRAQALGLHALELQSRIELIENHTAFRKMGFEVTKYTAHEGFIMPTSVTMSKSIISKG